MLRRALSQSMHQLKLANSDAGAMVDRRIVTKLLLTWMDRGRSDQSVLNLMGSMLGFTGEPFLLPSCHGFREGVASFALHADQ